LRKAFLRSPIDFAPVTSGFSDARLHPILQTWRAHKGVDYAAPTGTPVLAVADGIVEAADHQNGYGNLMVVRHAGSYSTAYGHLDAFAAGIRQGARVRQGDIIGTVGQTGLATGPHLHYEFRVNDQQVDPLTLDLPRSMPLAGAAAGALPGSADGPGGAARTRHGNELAHARIAFGSQAATAGRRHESPSPARVISRDPDCRSASRT
jgi:murein DD-endopeptidase MepM/ murein hydrolase activator NlpD